MRFPRRKWWAAPAHRDSLADRQTPLAIAVVLDRHKSAVGELNLAFLDSLKEPGRHYAWRLFRMRNRITEGLTWPDSAMISPKSRSKVRTIRPDAEGR